MGFELWIASRYIWSKRRHPFVGIIGAVSVLGICVGVAVLIIVLGVMSGFDEELKERIIGMHAHVVIQKDGRFLQEENFLNKIDSTKDVKGSSFFIDGQAFLQTPLANCGVLVRGIDLQREAKVSKFNSYLKEGRLTETDSGVVLGVELAKKLKVGAGAEVFLISEKLKKPKAYRVEGIFTSGMYEYDANLVYMTLQGAQKLFALDGEVTGLSVAIKKSDEADKVKVEIQKALGYPYYVMTWMDMNRTLFSVLKLEKIVMFLILAMIILVACLNIAGSLTIMVMDKTRDIGILKALGAPPMGLVKIFLIDGLFIGVIGSGLGLAIGVGVCKLLKAHSFLTLPKEIYNMDKLPVQMSLFDNTMVIAVAISLSLIASLYPALVAGKLDPVKALRYE